MVRDGLGGEEFLPVSRALLCGDRITKSFGGLVVRKKIDFVVQDGEILGLIGPNGAGKTTLFNILSKLLNPDRGRMLFAGRDTTCLQSFQVCRVGIGRTFQEVQPLPFFPVPISYPQGLMSIPPSTRMMAPVTKFAFSDTRKATISAGSCGSPMCPKGILSFS